MPVLFSENGFNVVVTDPPYAGYTWDSDLSIYDGYDNIKAYITEGAYNNVPARNGIEDGGKTLQERYTSHKKNYSELMQAVQV